jgi:hypothetical protein
MSIFLPPGAIGRSLFSAFYRCRMHRRGRTHAPRRIGSEAARRSPAPFEPNDQRSGDKVRDANGTRAARRPRPAGGRGRPSRDAAERRRYSHRPVALRCWRPNPAGKVPGIAPAAAKSTIPRPAPTAARRNSAPSGFRRAGRISGCADRVAASRTGWPTTNSLCAPRDGVDSCRPISIVIPSDKGTPTESNRINIPHGNAGSPAHGAFRRAVTLRNFSSPAFSSGRRGWQTACNLIADPVVVVRGGGLSHGRP